MKTPDDKTVIFTYYSHPEKDLRMRWVMKLTFPAGATAETPLRLDIVDGENAPVASGLMEVAGCKVAIRDGEGTFPYADFVKGKHEGAIWLHREGMPPVPGALTFA